MIELKNDSKLFPSKLINIKKNPEQIYVEGNISLINTVGIAVIGSRHHSDYGKRMCEFFVRELVKYGVTIVSGMAEGIDSIAHKTCIENGGNTIAVLPCGLKNIYPKKNAKLYNDIINFGGAVVSEYSENIEADSKKFLERNRIVSGLCIGTLVIEAGYRSGTSVTARLTKEQGRELFCVPSSLENYKGITSNKLIQDGGKLVTCVEDILNQFPKICFEKRDLITNNPFIDEEFVDVYNVLSYKPQHINEISKKCGNSINDVSYKLMMLELEEHAIQLRGKNFIRK